MARRDTEPDRLQRHSTDSIGREELKQKLDRGDDFQLVMTIGGFEFEAKHIPGSKHVQSVEEALVELDADEEIVVYCALEHCIASRGAVERLGKEGYTNVRRYDGGIVDWEDAGYPVAGRKGSASRQST